MNLKSWKTHSPQGQLTRKWRKPYLMILTTCSALRLQDHSWAHCNGGKRAPNSTETTPGGKGPLEAHVNLCLTWSFSSEKQQMYDQGASGHSYEPSHQGTLAYGHSPR